MLFILVEFACVDCTVRRGQNPLSISHVILPSALVPVLLSSEDLSLAVPLVLLPLTYVKVFVVVVAVTLTLSEVLSPLAMVLVIGALLLIRTVENAIAVTDDIPTIIKHLAIVVITVAVGILGLDSLNRARIVVPAGLLCWVGRVGTECCRGCCRLIAVERALTRSATSFRATFALKAVRYLVAIHAAGPVWRVVEMRTGTVFWVELRVLLQ